jgi:plastocyanin
VAEWVNLDLDGHTVSTRPAQRSLNPLSNGDWDSGLIGPGQSYQQRFDAPGTYTYVDQTNPANVAVIVVEESRLYLPIIVK